MLNLNYFHVFSLYSILSSLPHTGSVTDTSASLVSDFNRLKFVYSFFILATKILHSCGRHFFLKDILKTFHTYFYFFVLKVIYLNTSLKFLCDWCFPLKTTFEVGIFLKSFNIFSSTFFLEFLCYIFVYSNSNYFSHSVVTIRKNYKRSYL